MSEFSKLIEVTDYEVLGELPDVFRMDNGGRADTEEKWAARRKEIYRTAVELQYGTQPPKPEVLEVETLYVSDKQNSYRITAGTKEKQLSFYMKLFHPVNNPGPYKTAVDGDLCFAYMFNEDFYHTMIDADFALCLFDRTMLAHDIRMEGRRQGALYEIYPEYTFGALGAWAWGYSVCVDALQKLGLLDASLLAFTGHSRGAKAAMLAGVLDERAVIINPNETNAGSCSCYRIHMKAIMENGREMRSETLKDLYTVFPFWLGEGMEAYMDREQDLPFDCHFLKALAAPRILLLGEAASDIWTNPIGAWQTTQAAREVYRFLGKEENLLWYYRRGYHYHQVEDLEHLADVMSYVRGGGKEVLKKRYFETPFTPPERIFSWTAPDRKES